MDDPDLIDRTSFRLFVERAALWRFAQVPAIDVVDAAVQVLVDGIESPSIVSIACLMAAEAESELAEHLNDLDDLGLLAYGHTDTEVIAAAALCRTYLQDRSDSQAFTSRIHRIFGHDCHPLIEAISKIDDMFDRLDYVPNTSRERLATSTQAAARSLVDEADRTLTRATRK